MSTLWKRANGPQWRMLKIVSGAVLNAAHHHPNQRVDKAFARSVAKRAVGTISSEWTELLAVNRSPLSGKPSGSVASTGLYRHAHRSPVRSDGGGESQVQAARPFVKLCAILGRRIRPLRAAGDHEAADAIEAAIRAIAPIVRRERGKPPLP